MNGFSPNPTQIAAAIPVDGGDFILRIPGWTYDTLAPGETSYIDRWKAREARLVVEMIDDLPDSEQAFVKESRKIAQKRADARKARTEQQDRDRTAVQDLANAMFGEVGSDIEAIAGLDPASVAGDAEVALEGKRGERLWIEAGGLLRDYVREVAKATAEGRSADDVDFTMDYDRDVRIATAEMGTENVTPRQRQLMRDYMDRDDYMDRVRNEPGVARTVIRTDAAGNPTSSVPIRFTQSASDRFDKDGRGFVADVAGYYGGSSTQRRGGTCFQKPFVEKGKRSSKSAMIMRIVAMVPKVKSRRRGITNEKVIARIEYLAESGLSAEEIAVDSEVNETVSRVRGTIHAAQNDGRAYSGNNNDIRMVHRKKRITLDDPHCSLRTDCLELIRVDKDQVWDTWEEFETWLHKTSWTVDGHQVLPQQVNYVRDDEFPERVTKPHIIFTLPADKGVWYKSATPFAMFNAVAAKLTVMYGGDAGGLANLSDIKLPTSPRVVSVDIQNDHLPNLSELCKTLDVDLRMDRDRTMRKLTVESLIAAGIDHEKSGFLYSLFWARGWEIVNRWEERGELVAGRTLDRVKLTAELLDALLTDPVLLPELDLLDDDAREAAEDGMATAAKNISQKFGRGKHISNRGYDVGAAEGLVAKRLAAAASENPDMPIDVKKIARSAGAAYGTAQRNARSVRRIADAMRDIGADGTVPTVALVSALTKIGERTVPLHWDAAVALLAARQIAQHVLTVPEPVSVPETNGSCVWGETTLDSLPEGPVVVPEPAQAVPGAPVALASVLSATALHLVNRLAPRDPASTAPHLGQNLLDFARSGFTVYRSTFGIREQARRRAKGLRVDPPTVASKTATGEIRPNSRSSTPLLTGGRVRLR